MRINRRGLLAAAAATPLAAMVGAGETVTVFEARRIVTMDRGLPLARFMAVAGGTVLGLGETLASLSAWTNGRPVVHERRFADRVLFPGLVDPHIHPMQAAVMLGLPFLAPDDWTLPSGEWPGVSGQDAYRARLKRIIAGQPGSPVIVWGHHELFHGPMDRAILDSIEGERPVLVWQRSFHDIYANSAALAWMGLAERSAFDAAVAAGGSDPHHADHARGMFSETALQVALAKLQPVLLAPDALMRGMGDLRSLMERRGVTTTSDLATGIFARFDTEAGLIGRAFNDPAARARVNLMPIAAEIDPVEDLDQWLAERRTRFASGNVSLARRVKLFADGAFFAQNMRMGPPGYTDGHLGKWLTEPAALHAQLRRYWDAGFALHIHVNGDEGADAVLDGLAALAPRRGQDIVLEHLGYCTEAQLRRIARMGLMVSAQPNYIRVLGEAYGRHGFGPDRAALMNRLGSL